MADLASRITKPADDAAPASETPAATDTAAAETHVGDAQNDGAVESLGGSGLQEPGYEVEITLSDLQQNEATPFHSATTWEDIGLYVTK